ncbi:MAG: hypothetical protein V4564_01235 [Pseudomonadota bacterium]|uniref:hypothetical protein n=1 Tax=Sphingomonas sp. ERG5 TaxID=1381597 RepID=UPI00068C2153|nr:hypothetical protein [Sphingomonas sp. ERG5]
MALPRAGVKNERGWPLAGRLAAIPGGYVLASLAVACLARLLPIARVEAVTIAMLAFFALYAVLLIWAFAARSVLRLWLWMGGASLVLGVTLAVSILLGGRA